MADRRVYDPRKLHLKKELTQIRKASRVLPDPGTTSSWRSPLSSTKSVAAAAVATATATATASVNLSSTSAPIYFEHETDARDIKNENEDRKEKRVFLYNWKNYRSSSEKSSIGRHNEDDNGDEGSLLAARSVNDRLSDLQIGDGGDSKSDAYVNMKSLILPSFNRAVGVNKKIKKNDARHLDALARYHKKETVLHRKSVNSRRSLHSSLDLNDLVNGTEDYCDSEDFANFSGESPLLAKLKRGNWSHSSSKLLRINRKEDSSYSYDTPALSTSSYNRYANRYPSTVGSWDVATTPSMKYSNDDDDDEQLDLPNSQGCGIPCYWSKRTPRSRGGCRSCYSPSLSDTLRRKDGSILHGSRSAYHRRIRSLSGFTKRKISSRSAQGLLPFLRNTGNGRGGSMINDNTDDELSSNFGELNLEALSRMDGRKWSASGMSLEELGIALNREGEEEGSPENMRSLTHKYKPLFFEELIGQNFVVQSLSRAISRGRVAPVYLFQGPRGTGKTSTARIFAKALNCLATEEIKPCGYCSECINFITGESKNILEVDGTNKNGIDEVRCLLSNMLAKQVALSRYMIFIVDECHLFPSKTWLAFLKFLEQQLQRVVFIFVTTDVENVPHSVQSRCQNYHFSKIKESDIVAKLRRIAADEKIDFEPDALELIALNADGSLREAETIVDQLSLLGKRITRTLVNELVGIVSDEKLLELLELAMSSDTAETVKRARQFMDSGVDPMVLMSQMASLIMDIISGTYKIVKADENDSSFGGRSLTEAESQRLKHALKLLSEAEKQLRVSSERSTWFTATLLQLGSVTSSDLTQSGSSRRQNSRTTDEESSSVSRESPLRLMSDEYNVPSKSSSTASLNKEVDETFSHQGSTILQCGSSNNLDKIWARCIEKCHSRTLRQLLHTHGKLVSISKVEGVLIAYLAFADVDIKSRAERFMNSIINSIETVLRCKIEVRIILLPDSKAYQNSVNPIESPEGRKQMRVVKLEKERKAVLTNALNKVSRGSSSDLEKLKGTPQDYNSGSPLLQGTHQSTAGYLGLLAEGNDDISGTKEINQEISLQRIESITNEQRLETAWLQATEKGANGSLSHLKPERNQVFPQDGRYHKKQVESMNSSGFSPQCWEDELNHDLKVLTDNDRKTVPTDQIGRILDNYPMSPSLLHDSGLISNLNKDNLGYESGTGTGGGCCGFFCCNSTKSEKRRKVKRASGNSRKV